MGLRWMTAGESHGPALVGILAGLPSDLKISIGKVDQELTRRQEGIGRSKRQQIETDKARILAGIRHGKTIGSPIAVLIENKDHENWRDAMSVTPSESEDKGNSRAFPRPGHADLAGMLKWGLDDARNVLERASGRTTAVTVAIGALCKQYLQHFKIYIGSRILKYGAELLANDDMLPPTREDIGVDGATVLTLSELSNKQIKIIRNVVRDAREDGDTLGGLVQVIAAHVTPGLGSCAIPDERIDFRLSAAMMGVPGIKAIEIGAGYDQAYMKGKQAHDEFAIAEKPFYKTWYGRSSNLAGGIEGGITNGEPVCLTAWMKPLSTVNPPHASIDRSIKNSVELKSSERSDVAAVESAACVLEAVVAMELAKAHREKFGGDSILEVDRAVESYMKSIDL